MQYKHKTHLFPTHLSSTLIPAAALAAILVLAAACNVTAPAISNGTATTPAAATTGTSAPSAKPAASQTTPATQTVQGVARINHLIVIYQENWSFDGLYGKFPGANGIANAGDALKQVQKDGTLYKTLPQPWDSNLSPSGPDPRFPANLPVAPYDASKYASPDSKTGDLLHRFYQHQYQIDGGKNDMFLAWSNNPGLTMSYFDATNMPEGKLAQQYTMADNFFAGTFGGSFINHMFLVCACAAPWPDAPASQVVTLDAKGILSKDGEVSPDGYVVNTAYPMNHPYPDFVKEPAQRVPLLTMPTIGDRLSDKGLTWAWYSGGWNDAVAGKPDPLFQYHHQPFNYFANLAEGTEARKQHLKDVVDFQAALKDGSLPAVSFIKPLGSDNEHPGYTKLARGQKWVADLVKSVQDSSFWKDTAIIIAYDEFGGRWDHVAPPVMDRWGPGTRVPAIIISPYARKGFVDHTEYNTASILSFIETRWNLKPLGTRDAKSNNLLNAFDFTQNP